MKHLSVACFALALSACAGVYDSPVASPPTTVATASHATPAIAIATLAEKRIAQLPAGPLFWRIEAFPTLAAAQNAVGPTSLAAEVSGRAWLFTLGPAHARTPGSVLVTEVGPVPALVAPEYLLRINHATGAPGAVTPVHTHAGSETFYVLTGRLSQRTQSGVMSVTAGHAMNGHAPGAVMQLTSSGDHDLDQVVMFVVDASKPFSSPAQFQ